MPCCEKHVETRNHTKQANYPGKMPMKRNETTREWRDRGNLLVVELVGTGFHHTFPSLLAWKIFVPHEFATLLGPVCIAKLRYHVKLHNGNYYRQIPNFRKANFARNAIRPHVKSEIVRKHEWQNQLQSGDRRPFSPFTSHHTSNEKCTCFVPLSCFLLHECCASSPSLRSKMHQTHSKFFETQAIIHPKTATYRD